MSKPVKSGHHLRVDGQSLGGDEIMSKVKDIKEIKARINELEDQIVEDRKVLDELQKDYVAIVRVIDRLRGQPSELIGLIRMESGEVFAEISEARERLSDKYDQTLRLYDELGEGIHEAGKSLR